MSGHSHARSHPTPNAAIQHTAHTAPMNTIGKRVMRLALRAALLYALKKGIEVARRRAGAPAPQVSGRRSRDVHVIH